jgi:L-rhamnose mutarotase
MQLFAFLFCHLYGVFMKNPPRIRKAFTLRIKPGSAEEYTRRHSPIWPDLEATLRTHGVSNYSIHLNPETNELFGYAEIESEERWNAIAQTDACQRWWAHMADIMVTNLDGSPASQPLVECFHMP